MPSIEFSLRCASERRHGAAYCTVQHRAKVKVDGEEALRHPIAYRILSEEESTDFLPIHWIDYQPKNRTRGTLARRDGRFMVLTERLRSLRVSLAERGESSFGALLCASLPIAGKHVKHEKQMSGICKWSISAGQNSTPY